MQYDKGFKLQTLELSDDIGVRKDVEQLGIPYYTLAEWRTVRKHKGVGAFVGSGHQSKPLSDKGLRIKALEGKIRESERANEILKEAMFFFASSRKK